MSRLGVYTDYTYSFRDGSPHAQRAFALFLAALAEHFDRTLLIGRLDPDGDARYPLGKVELTTLPGYPSLSHALHAARGMLGSLRPFWRALDGLDVVWILGPHPLAFAFAGLARLRGRSVVLGVRQDSVSYMRWRHPGSRVKLALAWMMNWGFRMLSRRWPVVVVGPGIAASYGHSSRLLEISVSLVAEEQIATPEEIADRSFSGSLRALSVGRLEAEKNPLALADLLAELRRLDDRWHLVVCGEGDMRPALERRLTELGVAHAAEFRGYVPYDRGLADEYRTAHALALVSWTEGLPQVLFEAFAAGLPVAATDVGGIAAAVGNAVLLAPAGDAERMAKQVFRIGTDSRLREDLIENGLALARAKTIDAETARVASFIEASQKIR